MDKTDIDSQSMYVLNLSLRWVMVCCVVFILTSCRNPSLQLQDSISQAAIFPVGSDIRGVWHDGELKAAWVHDGKFTISRLTQRSGAGERLFEWSQERFDVAQWGSTGTFLIASSKSDSIAGTLSSVGKDLLQRELGNCSPPQLAVPGVDDLLVIQNARSCGYECDGAVVVSRSDPATAIRCIPIPVNVSISLHPTRRVAYWQIEDTLHWLNLDDGSFGSVSLATQSRIEPVACSDSTWFRSVPPAGGELEFVTVGASGLARFPAGGLALDRYRLVSMPGMSGNSAVVVNGSAISRLEFSDAGVSQKRLVDLPSASSLSEFLFTQESRIAAAWTEESEAGVILWGQLVP